MNSLLRISSSLLIMLAGAFATAASTKSTTDSLLLVLDGIVAQKANYEAQKRASIERHLYRLKNAVEQQAIYAEYSTLFDRYRLRTRNKAIVPKDHFVESVQNLC